MKIDLNEIKEKITTGQMSQTFDVHSFEVALANQDLWQDVMNEKEFADNVQPPVKAEARDIVMEQLYSFREEWDMENQPPSKRKKPITGQNYKCVQESYMQRLAKANGGIKLPDKLDDQQLEAMFSQDDDQFFSSLGRIDDKSLKPQEYVKMCTERAKKYFDIDRGYKDAKKTHLADIKSTKIVSSTVLCAPLFDPLMPQERKATTMLRGNVKALIPLCREKFELEWDSIEIVKKKYRRIDRHELNEELIFGVVTAKQVGHIPNTQISFTQDELNFSRDTYMFKPLLAGNDGPEAKFDFNAEIYHQFGVDTFSKQALHKEEVDQAVDVATIQQVQIFHSCFSHDLFKRTKLLVDEAQKMREDPEAFEKIKKYYFVPLKLKGKHRYVIDHALLEKVERLHLNGYAAEQDNVMTWLYKQPELKTHEQRLEKLRASILVKEDKPSSCYNFEQLLINLKEMSADEVAIALKGKAGTFGCKTGYELIFEAPCRFSSIKYFRDVVNRMEEAKPGVKQKILEAPIIVLNQQKSIHHEKIYKYDLLMCARRPNAKAEERKKYNQRHDVTGNQGVPIITAHLVYKHYLDKTQWERASQLPAVLSFFERCLHSNEMLTTLNLPVHPEFAVWATSCSRVGSSRKSYETMETYGDTILKLAATTLAYQQLEMDPKANERRIIMMKDAFVTNLNLYRLGMKLQLKKYVRSNDPNPCDYNPPFSIQTFNEEIGQRCTGKNVADVVESLLGAVFLSTNLRRTLQVISDMQLVPLEQAGLLDWYPNRELTFDLPDALEQYGFELEDNVQQLFAKYWAKTPQVKPAELSRLKCLIDPALPVRKIGQAVNEHFSRSIGQFESEQLSAHLITCLRGLERKLDYHFTNKKLLLEAMTHSTFMDAYNLPACYEKLEVLGDSILDYVANANLIKFTMFERYNLEERLQKVYITQEDFQPFDASQAKSMLTKNDFLAQLMCLYGFHEYILVSSQTQKKVAEMEAQLKTASKKDGEYYELKRKCESLSELVKSTANTDYFITQCFKKDFCLNQFEITPYKASKILGDVFEAIIGAIFKDGGIDEVNRVLKSLMAPFVLYVAKFSKKVHKEPKEEFLALAKQLKICPELRCPNEYKVDGQKQMKQDQVKLSVALGRPLPESEDVVVPMHTVSIVYNNGEVMAKSYGFNKAQAERNASILGLKWLKENKRDEIDTLLKNSLFKKSLKACYMQHSK